MADIKILGASKTAEETREAAARAHAEAYEAGHIDGTLCHRRNTGHVFLGRDMAGQPVPQIVFGDQRCNRLCALYVPGPPLDPSGVGPAAGVGDCLDRIAKVALIRIAERMKPDNVHSPVQ